MDKIYNNMYEFKRKSISKLLNRTSTITDSEYIHAIQTNDYNTLFVYYYIDNQDKYEIADKLFSFFRRSPFADLVDSARTLDSFLLGMKNLSINDMINKYTIFMKMLKNPNDDIPVNHNIEKLLPKFINLSYYLVQDVLKSREKFNKVKKELLNNFEEVEKNIKKREKTFSMIMNDDKEELQDYFNKNNIQLRHINGYGWDILIFAIDRDASMDLIKYLIEKYEESNISLNYFIIQEDNRFETPLYKAISKKNLDVAKLLLEKGADINFKKDGLEPMYLYTVDFLDEENLKFLLHHGYNNYIYLLKKCIYNDLTGFSIIKNGHTVNMGEMLYDMIMHHYIYHSLTEEDLWLPKVELDQKIQDKKDELIYEFLKDFKDAPVISRFGYYDGNSSLSNFYQIVLKDEKDKIRRKELVKKYEQKFPKNYEDNSSDDYDSSNSYAVYFNKIFRKRPFI